MLNRKTMLAAVIAACAPAIAFAQDAAKPDAPKADAPKPALPSLDDLLGSWGITTTGYISTSYMHANRAPTDRLFDNEKNSFSLDQAAITIAKQPKEGFGALVNVIAGRDAKQIHSNGLGTNEAVDLTQAFLQYATGPFTVIGGKFLTLAGYEVIAPVGNNQYSRSLIFFAEPFTHTGVRGTWAAMDNLTLTLGVNNGWDQVDDLNSQKTVEAAVSFTPIKTLTLNLVDYYGLEPVTSPTGPTNGKRNLLDFTSTWTPIDPLSLGIEVLYTQQDQFASIAAPGTAVNAKQEAVALYAAYQFTDQWKLSGRAEYFKDKDGIKFGIPDNKIKEFTLTLAFMPAKSVEIRGEVRADKVSNPNDQGIFLDSDGTLSKSLFTYAVQALYKF
jgi:hypothetical protein